MKKHFFNILILLSFFIRPLCLSSQPSSQIFPKNNFTFHSDSVYFFWNSVNDAYYYELNISEDPLFTTNNSIYHISNLRSDTSIKNLALCKKYYWKIKTIAQSGVYYSTVKTFNIFTPRCIPGLELWLSADSGVVTDGLGNISNWIDRSGNGNNAIQSTTTNQPLLLKDIADTTNKCSFIKMDGSDDYMNLNHSLKVASFFLAFNWGTITTNFPGYNSILTTQVYTSKGIVFMGLAGTPNFYDDGTSNTFSPGEVEFNGNTTLNMSPISDFKLCSAIKSSSTTLSNFYIGRYLNDPTSFWNGNIGDMIIYNVPLTSIEKIKVESYVYDKYAPPVNLGADQTTCSFPIVLRAKKNYFKTYIWQDGSTADSLVINSPGTYYITTTNRFGITSSDTVIINYDTINLLTNLGSNDTILCNGNALFLYGGPNHLSYIWSNGSTHNNITVSTPGKYYVTMTNCLNNISTDTITVKYKQSPIFSLGNDTTICYNSNLILESIYSDSLTYLFTWSNGVSTPSIIPTLSGMYWLNIINNYFCSYTDTINIQIDASLNTISLGSDISLCAGNQIALSSGLQPGLSYTWVTGETTPAITVVNTAEYSVIITNTNNCIAKDTINVTITGQAPNPNFTFNTACINNQIQFTDASSAPSGNSIASYLWDFGDPLSASNTSTLSNPTHSYTNTGIYTVSLTISTDVGCSKSITKTLTVSPTPTVNFNFGIACQNSAVTFTGSINSGTLTTTATTWNFGDPASGANNSSALLNPSHLFSNQANYPVKLIATNSAGCKDSITKIVNVRGEVKADFTYSAPCANSNVLFQDNSITPAPSNVHTRTWNFSNSANTFIGLTTNQTFTNSGVYSASLTVTGTNGCVSSISKLITVQLKPVVNFTVPPLCAKDTVNIINNSSVGSGVFSSFNWQLNTNPISSIGSPTLSIANSGTYSLSLKITNSAQCSDSLTKLITVFALPTVDFETNPPIYLFLDSTVAFIPNSTTGSFYQWEINSEVFNTVSPTYTFNTIGTYSVSLFMRDENGCGNSQLKTIRVFDHYLDLAIRDIITSLDNENFLRVKANLLNMGSVPISRFEISKRINSISDSKESWIGQLNPGNQLLYEFVSTNKLSNTADNKIICLQIESINLITDNNTTNNNLCVALKTNGNEVFEPYPNPSFKEDVIIPILLTNDQIVSIELYNTVGEIVITTLSYTGTEGLNFIKIPSSELSRGTYLLKLTINEKVFMKKLMKN